MPRNERVRIAEKIYLLGQNPDNPILDIKALEGSSVFRLRVSGWRVIFMRDDAVRVIAVERIAARGDVYK